MEGVNHVYVVQIGGGRLIGQVHRVLQREVPNGEGFKFCISGLNSPFIFMIQLRKAGGHFPAARAGRCDHHQRAAGLHILVLAETFVADDMRYIGGISLNGVMEEDLYACLLYTSRCV